MSGSKPTTCCGRRDVLHFLFVIVYFCAYFERKISLLSSVVVFVVAVVFLVQLLWLVFLCTCFGRQQRAEVSSRPDDFAHVRLTGLCLGLPGWAGTRKVKTIWILLKQETVSGSSISWAACKSAPRSRQITRPDALPATQPTASKHWSKSTGPVDFAATRRPVRARGRCRISQPRFLAECRKRQLNQVSLVLLHFRLSTFSDLYWVCLSVFSCTVLFVSISQVIGCEDRLRNDLYCVEWGVKLYSNQPTNLHDSTYTGSFALICS